MPAWLTVLWNILSKDWSWAGAGRGMLMLIIGAGAMFYVTKCMAAQGEVNAYMGMGVRNSVGSALIGGNYQFRHKNNLDSWRVGLEGWSNISNPPVTTTTTMAQPEVQALHHGEPPPPPEPVPYSVTTTSTCDDSNVGAYAAWAPQWRYFYAMLGTMVVSDSSTCNVDQRWLGYAAAMARLPVTETVDITGGWVHKSDWFGDAADDNHIVVGGAVRF